MLQRRMAGARNRSAVGYTTSYSDGQEYAAAVPTAAASSPTRRKRWPSAALPPQCPTGGPRAFPPDAQLRQEEEEEEEGRDLDRNQVRG
jgi:hypothetical protein